jgi:hypothetical protein
MTKALAWVAIVALILSLGSTFLAIWLQVPAKGDLLRLTELLLSWQVIAGGLAIGGGSTFKEEIKKLLGGAAR